MINWWASSRISCLLLSLEAARATPAPSALITTPCKV